MLGCRADTDIISDVKYNAEYSSKSLWKEDEVFVKNVKNIFDENLDVKTFSIKYGLPMWDYATTFGNFDESFLMAPLIKENLVTGVITSTRINDKVYFKLSTDREAIVFFQNLLYPKDAKIRADNQLQKSARTVCSSRTYTMCFPDEFGDNCLPPNTVTTCVEINESINEDPNGGGYDDGFIYGGGIGGGGSTSPSPNDTNNKDTCEKVKTNLNNTKFKEKFIKLTKPEVFNLDHEKGAFERYPPKENTSIQPSFVDIENGIGTTNMDLPDDKSGIVGLLHSHNNEDKNGNHPVKIFSPTDVRTFINHLMPQANNYTGSYTNAYSVVTTSESSYMLKYTKDTWPGSINFEIKESWQSWYKDQYTNLLLENAMSQTNVEKIFTQFLKEIVKIDGLELYKITESTSNKLEYNGINEPVKSTQCP